MNGEEITRETTAGKTVDQCPLVLCISPRGIPSRLQTGTQTGERAHLTCAMAREDCAPRTTSHKRCAPPARLLSHHTAGLASGACTRASHCPKNSQGGLTVQPHGLSPPLTAHTAQALQQRQEDGD